VLGIRHGGSEAARLRGHGYRGCFRGARDWNRSRNCRSVPHYDNHHRAGADDDHYGTGADDDHYRTGADDDHYGTRPDDDHHRT
ncbi:hypothetical protein NLX62_07085, partial [Mycobacteriaceae bacterium Msp059]|nr:hypothetical protein [Mycobacteriaceae bacterium Msp059]